MNPTRFFAALMVLCAGSAASAQTTTVEEGGLSILVDRPTDADGGRIDCSSVQQDSCQPLNALSCDFAAGQPAASEDRPFDVQLSSNNNVPVNSRLLAFLTTNSDCEFAQASEIENTIDSFQLLSESDPLVSQVAFNFPADYDVTVYGSVAEILAESGACETPVDRSLQRLCFVASPDDDIAESGEPFAAVLMLIDTVAPGPPDSLEVLPRDGAIEVNIDTDEPALLFWNIRFREAVGDDETCDLWGDESTTRRRRIANQFDQSFTETVENGLTYEVCVFAEDEAGNLGDVSETATVTPQDECDFIECFPGEFDDGCATGGSSLAAVFAVLSALALGRRRRRGAA